VFPPACACRVLFPMKFGFASFSLGRSVEALRSGRKPKGLGSAAGRGTRTPGHGTGMAGPGPVGPYRSLRPRVLGSVGAQRVPGRAGRPWGGDTIRFEASSASPPSVRSRRGLSTVALSPRVDGQRAWRGDRGRIRVAKIGAATSKNHSRRGRISSPAAAGVCSEREAASHAVSPASARAWLRERRDRGPAWPRAVLLKYHHPAILSGSPGCPSSGRATAGKTPLAAGPWSG
jgi:hypothetical protein